VTRPTELDGAPLEPGDIVLLLSGAADFVAQYTCSEARALTTLPITFTPGRLLSA
jgi:hypothetical protein